MKRMNAGLVKACTTSYAIELLPDEYDAMEKEDRDGSSGMLYEKLYDITGLDEIDYNGHFGSYVYLSINREDDTPETWKLIDDTIDGHIA